MNFESIFLAPLSVFRHGVLPVTLAAVITLCFCRAPVLAIPQDGADAPEAQDGASEGSGASGDDAASGDDGAAETLAPEESATPEETVANADEASPWETDLAAAAKRAKAEGKDLFVNFTGSDWCRYCIMLEKEVLGEQEFVDAATEDYVLVMIDFPQDKSRLREEQRLANDNLKRKYGIKGFPTIVLLDADQRPYGFLGYAPGGVEPFVKSIDQLKEIRVQRDALLAKAHDADGEAKARLLDEALDLLDESLRKAYYSETIDQIVALDDKNKLGLKQKYLADELKEQYEGVLSDITLIARLQKPEPALKFIDSVVATVELPPEYQLQVQQIRFDLLRTLGRIDDAVALIDQLLRMEGVEEDSSLAHRWIVRKARLLASADRRDEAYQLLDESISSTSENLYLLLGKGELLEAEGKFEQAIATFDHGINRAGGELDIKQALYSAKADCLFALDRYDDALGVLGKLIGDEGYAADLRADSALHKAIIMRVKADNDDNGNLARKAKIQAKRAVEYVKTVREKAEVQRLVDKLNAMYQ